MLASEGIYTTADQTDPSLIHPIDFRFSSLLGLKLPNTQTPSLICQSSASDRSSSSGVPARRWCDGSSAGQKTPRTFHFISIKDACLQSSVMAGDGGWQLINNERIPFNLWPGSFPDRVCHTDFSLHLSHLTTLLPETKRSKSPERNVHIECLLQISEHWGWWNSFDMLIWAWNWGEIFTCCSDVQVCPVTSLVGVVTGGQQSSQSPLRTFNSSSLLYFHLVLKFFLFRSMLNYMLFVLKEQYVKILVKTFRN